MMTRTTNVFGDQIAILSTPNGHWMSPAHGETYIEAADAMRAELRAYMESCGEDPDALADAIEGYIAEMRDGDDAHA